VARGLLAAAGMVLDCCALPHDHARGLRLGTAAVTTQGMGEQEMTRVAALLAGVLREEIEGKKARDEVRELSLAFPPYPG
jgi:glycine hydroxymethyltransferase